MPLERQQSFLFFLKREKPLSVAFESPHLGREGKFSFFRRGIPGWEGIVFYPFLVY